jgi:hypothetical protein
MIMHADTPDRKHPLSRCLTHHTPISRSVKVFLLASHSWRKLKMQTTPVPQDQSSTKLKPIQQVPPAPRSCHAQFSHLPRQAPYASHICSHQTQRPFTKRHTAGAHSWTSPLIRGHGEQARTQQVEQLGLVHSGLQRELRTLF